MSKDQWTCLYLYLFIFQINMTHLIRHLSFGKDYPGIVNPLDDTNVTAPQGQSIHGLFGFFCFTQATAKVKLASRITPMLCLEF